MKSILFIIPSLKTGGTNSSLASLYNCLQEDYKIKVFAISHQPNNNHYPFDDDLLEENYVLSRMTSSFSCHRGFDRLPTFAIKCVQSLYRIAGHNFFLTYARHVVKKIEANMAFDYIVAFEEGISTAFATLFSNPNKIAWVHCNYDMYLSKDSSEEILYERFKRIICVSNYTASVFSARYPALANRVSSIHNLIDCSRITSLSSEIIEDERFKKNGLTILSVGRFFAVKRFREIPRIAAELIKQGLSFRWFVIGPAYDDSETSAFEQNMLIYGTKEYVIWLGEKVNPYPYFKETDQYVCLSESEACPMVFLEAKLFNIPIVTTDFPSAREFVKDGEGTISPLEDLPQAIINQGTLASFEGKQRIEQEESLVKEQLRKLFV